jgi:hypothetical protein
MSILNGGEAGQLGYNNGKMRGEGEKESEWAGMGGERDDEGWDSRAEAKSEIR